MRRIREAGRGLRPGPAPDWSAPLHGSDSSTRWPTTSTPRARSAAVFDWVREANRARPAPSATTICARCSMCSGSPTCSSRTRSRSRPRCSSSRDARERARAERDCAEADRMRDELAGARLGGPGRARRAGAAAGRVIVYGRNPVREAIRGPRTVRACGRPRTPRASRGSPAAGRVAVAVADAEEIERRCGSREHQGVCAEVTAVRLRRRRRAARRAPIRCSSRSTRSRIRRTSARSAARPNAPAPPGW